MKSCLVATAVILTSLPGFPQGTVNFANDTSSRITDATLGNALVTAAHGILVGLYWAPVSDPNNFTQLGTSVTVGSEIPGLFTGGARTTGASTPGGNTGRFQVRAWEAAYGSTFELAIAAPNMNGRPAKRGVSNIMEVPTGNPMGSPATNPANLTSFNLQPYAVDVPEPTIIALAVIGVGAMLLRQRKRLV